MKEKKLTVKEQKKLQIRLQKKQLKKNAKSLAEALIKQKKFEQKGNETSIVAINSPEVRQQKYITKKYKRVRVISNTKTSSDDTSEMIEKKRKFEQSTDKIQRKIVRKKRKSMKSNFTLVEELKKDWNTFRMKSVSIEEKQKIIGKTLSS